MGIYFRYMTNVYFQRTFQRIFGTYPLKGDAARDALRTALEVGYRSIDTAQSYGNEAEIGETLRHSGIARDELCITTKVRPENYDPALFLRSVERSLADLQLDFVDVLLLHWPPLDRNIEPSLALLEQARQRGMARHIGVSNYTAAMMRRAAKVASVPLACNQVEFHPLLDQSILLAAAAETGIPLSSHVAVARGAVFKEPLLQELAASYDVTIAQIALRWVLQKGVSVNAMSTDREHIRQNFDVMNFVISSVDMMRIDRLNAQNLRIITRTLSPYTPDWD
jgi:2,5-diketo-D-gluconate reductase B